MASPGGERAGFGHSRPCFAAEPLPAFIVRAHLRVEVTPFRLVTATDQSELVPTVLLELELATWR